jgi:group I intron endonuclease
MSIYKITCTANGTFYIGSTKDFDKRKCTHLNNLRLQNHVNTIMQNTFNKYGAETFKFEIVEEILDSSQLFVREQYWIDTTSPQMNIGSVGGGDNLTNHPNKTKIIEKIRQSIKQKYKNMTDEEKKAKHSRPGASNPNYKGGISVSYCECGNRKQVTANKCRKCRDFTGEANSFYGKHHTKEVCEKLRKLGKERHEKGVMPPNAVIVTVNGTTFNSYTSAAKSIGCTISTVINRCKNPKFPEYISNSINAERLSVKEYTQVSGNAKSPEFQDCDIV